MLETGTKAPDFTLQETNGKPITLSDYRGKNVVLYFYPKDMTPGCTTEACDFRDQNSRFEEVNTVVLGISTDPIERHQKFAVKHELPFTLLSDPNHEVAETYGSWQLKNMFGKKSMGIVRSTFVMDREGTIRKVWPKVKVAGHVDDVFQFVKQNLV
ncbi:thioredoxin-dependent thiol peroxidase [Sporolactobacillus terrae]|uniref:thioredoxin-dependent peroxiredoxin n=1 Tax=Sporolactobacillus terrae TaxID=269673 RepID=A0ABX5Q981_9BACL|nr:thioredoxin-dependent thiol peroxidase [Sporolactobacillus terrae]QAA23223.1 thioredoxin-dependent thiol peroxidase [Sporolactobacillus terrae]QAA26193.1 thioredoxin-dependent thiol peroxidase [Sporolactobacillus terrae]UAK15290.1 thioredoxin-dependent thiol peroxidase [Sporolactobacillus terrae]